MKDPTRHHPDLDALLRRVPPEEAARLREVWTLARVEEPPEGAEMPDAEAAFERLQAAMQPPRNGAPHPTVRATRTPQRPPRKSRVGWTVGVSLGALVIAGLLGVFWWMQPVTQTAPPGQRLALTLPDGSHVELNSGSTVRYARRFGAERRVALRGEAFFEVKPEAAPFVVETDDAEVRVLGTRFNVRAWGGRLEPGTTVALETGALRLVPTGEGGGAVTLAPGETARVSGDAAMRLDGPNLSVEEATAWRRGDFIFKDHFFGVVLDEVERRFAVEIVVEPEALRQRRFNLALRQPPNAEAVVKDLAAAVGLRYHETSNGFALSQE